MAAPSLDSEFMQYWAQLNVVQKTSLLSVIKSFIEDSDPISLEQYNREINEAVEEINKGEVVRHEEVIRLWNEPDTPDLRRQLIQEEREAYFAGKGTNFSWEQTKAMAQNKEQRNAL